MADVRLRMQKNELLEKEEKMKLQRAQQAAKEQVNKMVQRYKEMPVQTQDDQTEEE